MKVLHSELGGDQIKPGEMVAFQGLTYVLDHPALREQTCYLWGGHESERFPAYWKKNESLIVTDCM